MIEKTVGEYLALLLEQMRYDIRILTNWWVIGFVVPWVLYFAFFLVKWYALLAPVTIPMTLWLTGKQSSRMGSANAAWVKKN